MGRQIADIVLTPFNLLYSRHLVVAYALELNAIGLARFGLSSPKSRRKDNLRVKSHLALDRFHGSFELTHRVLSTLAGYSFSVVGQSTAEPQIWVPLLCFLSEALFILAQEDFQ